MKEFAVDYVVEEIVARVNQKRDTPLAEDEQMSIRDKISAWSNRYERDDMVSQLEFTTGWELDSLPELSDPQLKYDIKKALWHVNPRERLGRDLKKFFKKNKFGNSLQESRKEEIYDLIRNDLYLPHDTKVEIVPNVLASALDEDDNIHVSLGNNFQKYLVHYNSDHESFDKIFKLDPNGELEEMNSRKILQSFADFDHKISALKTTIFNYGIFDRFMATLDSIDKVDLEAAITEEGYLVLATYNTSSAFTLHYTEINANGRVNWKSITASRYGDKAIETKDLKQDPNGQYYFKGQPLVPLKFEG